MKRLYASNAYDTSSWPNSHWRDTAEAPPHPRLENDIKTDVLIIGAGYAGLNATLALAKAGVETTVVEAGQPGWGASGRNAGFCCIGGTALTDKALARRFGANEGKHFSDFQEAAIRHVDANLDTYSIAAERGPDGEVHLAHSKKAWKAMKANAPKELRLVSKEALRDLGLYTPSAFGAEIHPIGFPLHPMKYALGLAAGAVKSGVKLFGDSPVTALFPEKSGWHAVTPHGSVKSRKVLIATNGYSSEDLPSWIAGRIIPVFSTILITRPLSEAERQAQGWTSQMMAYDSRRLLHYFRLLPDGRFLFGMRGGLSASPAEGAKTRALARQNFAAFFPSWQHVEIEREWSGLACLTGSLTPFAGPVPETEGVYAAFGWHGNGVSTASYAGHLIGKIIAGENLTLPAPLSCPPRRFPIPALRLLFMRAAYLWYEWCDGKPNPPST